VPAAGGASSCWPASAATLEFYDFVIFGIFAKDIADAIFPNPTPLISLMVSFAAFAAGYLARPIGGIVLSHFGDRYGRAARVPDLDLRHVGRDARHGAGAVVRRVGVAASVLMVVLRLVQGFCLGGELPGALTYVVETAPRHAPFVCSVVFSCVTLGVAAATESASPPHVAAPALVAGVGWPLAPAFPEPWRFVFRFVSFGRLGGGVAVGVGGWRLLCLRPAWFGPTPAFSWLAAAVVPPLAGSFWSVTVRSISVVAPTSSAFPLGGFCLAVLLVFVAGAFPCGGPPFLVGGVAGVARGCFCWAWGVAAAPLLASVLASVHPGVGALAFRVPILFC
jgi:MFS family permease